ncbi:ComEC/Rec2 family competence protein [Herbiconiux liangxiaofengii]|uniref:ComEC/Rec2 family competence protein n=1 Tax=Herbiconiux liangxiaofengii TaxID=3342795 RepID=UPI0035B740EE
MTIDLRLVPSAVGAWAVVWFLGASPEWSAVVAAGGWAAVLALLLVLLSRRDGRSQRGSGLGRASLGGGPVRVRRAVPAGAMAVGAVALVATAVFAGDGVRRPDGLELGRPIAGDAVLVVTGVPEAAQAGFFDADDGASVAAGETSPPSRFTIGAVLREFTAAGRATAARAPTLVFASLADPDAFRIGSTFRVRGSLSPEPPGGSHDFLLFAREPPAVVADPPWYLGWAGGVREAFRTATAHLPGDGAQLLTGLAIGDDSLVADDLVDDMTVSGLTHLTAVSGANCAVVVTAVMLVGGAVGLGRRLRITVSVVVLGLFVVLVTPEPSVLRAATMAVIVLVALAAGRPGAGLPPLALSVVVLLALDPALGRSAGFALSVLATAGLLVLTRPLAAVAARIMPRPLALALTVPVAAQLACQPVLFLLAPQLTPYTLPANLLAEPAAALVSVLGLIVCIAAVVAPGLAAWLAWLPWLPSAWIAAVARFFAAAPVAAIPVPDGVAAAVVAAVALLVVAATAFWAPGRPGRARIGAFVTVLGLVVTAGAIAGGQLGRSASVPRDWQLAACDIGQGDAVLVRSADEVALVDVGPEPEALAECLERLGISRIDLLVLTHYDRDHVGGLDAVVGRVDRALVGPPDGARDERMLARLSEAGAAVIPARRGLTGSLGHDRYDVLWPRPDSPLRGNDASVTVMFTGTIRMLFLGDLGELAQRGVDAISAVAPVDIVKVAHHGSADQSEALYAEARATLGVVSVGADNTYGHPTDALLGILGRTGTRVLRTDLAGLVVVAGTPGALTVWTERAVPP